MAEGKQPRLVGINHVAIEVGNIDEALAWYGQIFAFTLRGKGEHNAFIDMGDQFINMRLEPDYAVSGVEKRHVGLVVDDRSRIMELATAAGARFVDGPYLDFLDPWGNRLEIIEYANIQFTKAPNVMRGMGLALTKNDKARQELADKGMADSAKGHVPQGFVVAADGGKHFNSSTPGRCFAMKLLGRETGESIMMFEETLPAGTTSLFHLHHDSDEVIWVLAGEFSFMIGDTVTVGGPGTCAFMPRDIPHAWKNTGSETGRILALYTPAAAGGLIEELAENRPIDEEEERPKFYARHRWEVLGPNPL
jgi:quercetin dioxygenase-like cupin family protein/catechol 2,3-dioxygenase-like lactoylglutathione lyase family enzyme